MKRYLCLFLLFLALPTYGADDPRHDAYYDDAFERANENPLANGWAGPIDSDHTQQLLLNSNEVYAGAAATLSSSYYNTAIDGTTGVEAFINFNDSGTAADPSIWQLWFVTSGTQGTATPDGYLLQITISTASDDAWRIYRVDDGVLTAVGDSVDYAIGIRDETVYFSLASGTLTAAVYEHNNNNKSWTVVDTQTDSTYSGNMYFGLATDDQTTQVAAAGWGALDSTVPTRTYYIDADAADDHNYPCQSSGSPCNGTNGTMFPGVQIGLNCGDTVYFNAGDSWTISNNSQKPGMGGKSCTSSTPITWTYYGGTSRYIFTGQNAGIRLIEDDWVTIEHPSITLPTVGAISWIAASNDITITDSYVDGNATGACWRITRLVADEDTEVSARILFDGGEVTNCGVDGEGFYIGQATGTDGDFLDHTTNVTVQGMYIHDLDSTGVLYKGGTLNGLVQNNHIATGCDPAAVSCDGIHMNGNNDNEPLDPVTGHIIRWNRIHDWDDGVGSHGAGIRVNAMNVLIYENDIYDNETSGILVLDNGAAGGNSNPTVTAYNNTVTGNGSGAGILDSDASVSLVCVNNLLRDNGAANDADCDNGDYDTATGTDPLFVDETNKDFRLCQGANKPFGATGCTAASPLLNAGTPVGLPYKGTAPEMGAHKQVCEYFKDGGLRIGGNAVRILDQPCVYP